MAIRVFYHNQDLDGHCSGAIVKYRFPEAVMYPINYGDPFAWDEIAADDDVYMVDFALQPFQEMIALFNRVPKLVWIDHHSQVINDFKDYNRQCIARDHSYVSPNGIRDTTKAACELTWEYLFPDRPVPLAVKLLSLYDSWTYQGHELEDMVLPFQMRMRMEELDPKDWDLLAGMAWNNLFNSTRLDDLIEEGRLLLRYDEANKAKYARTYSFETTLHLLSHQVEKPRAFKAIAVNLGHTNSKVFDAVCRRECPVCRGSGKYHDVHCRNCNDTGYLEPYDLIVPFVRRSDKLWNVSLYSTKPDVDCGTIAKSFGGGGHKGAAGFQCKELPFEY